MKRFIIKLLTNIDKTHVDAKSYIKIDLREEEVLLFETIFFNLKKTNSNILGEIQEEKVKNESFDS